MRQAQIANKVRIITFTTNKTPTTVIVIYSDGHGKANSVLSRGASIQRQNPQQHGVLHHCTAEIRHGTTEIPLTLLRTLERINMDAPKDEKHRSPVKTANPPQAQQSHDESLNATLLDDIKNIVNLLERIKSSVDHTDEGHAAQLTIAAGQVADSIRYKLDKTTTQYKILDCFLKAIEFGGIGEMLTHFTGGLLTGITKCSITPEDASAALAELGSPITPEDARLELKKAHDAESDAAAKHAERQAGIVFTNYSLKPPNKHKDKILFNISQQLSPQANAAAVDDGNQVYQPSPAKKARTKTSTFSPHNTMFSPLATCTRALTTITPPPREPTQARMSPLLAQHASSDCTSNTMSPQTGADDTTDMIFRK